jgi:adenylyltransferase/sulfurtransferase
LYLAAAGVGTLGIVDFDDVDLSNLHRQIIHGTSAVGKPKVESAAQRLHDVNPNVELRTYRERLSSANALEIAREYDIIVDGTDNFATRYLVNDAAVLLGIPSVYGSVHRFEGQASVFGAPNGPCYRCLFREPPPPDLVPNCAEAGVLGVLPGLVGTIQATEAIKLITGVGEPLIGRLLMLDAAAMSFRTILIRKDPQCPACGTHVITELQDYEQFCGAPSPAAEKTGITEISARELETRLKAGGDFDLIDVREPYEWRMGHIEGARLTPLGDIPDEIARLNPERETILYCKMGSRSRHAAQQLAAAGMRNVSNLTGGIISWIQEVDPTIPRY